jgi:hypothetical protein
MDELSRHPTSPVGWSKTASPSSKLGDGLGWVEAGRWGPGNVSGMRKQGDQAPDFTLLDQNGEPFTLSESIKRRKVWHLVYFYP